MATTPSARLPAFATPTSLDLRGLQLVVNNIREGMQALDARITLVGQQAGQTTLNQGNDKAVLASLQNQLATLRAQLAALPPPGDASAAPLLSLVMIPGDDGEPGEDGMPGRAAESSSGPEVVEFAAAVALGGHRAVRLLAGEAIYADNAVVEDANVVLGITQGAVGAGDLAPIQTGGLMTEPSWTWTPDAPVFVGANGVLVQPSPITGFSLVVGVATSATQIHIGARTPLVLL